MPKVIVEVEVTDEQLQGILSGAVTTEEKPARGRRGRAAKEEPEEKEEKPARGRGGGRASRGPTKTAVKAIAAQVKSDCPKGTLDEILDEFQVQSIDDLDKADYEDFIKECEKDIKSV